MPQVPVYQPGQVQPRALPDVRQQAAATPQSEGAGIGQAVSDLGATAANGAFRLASDLVTEQRQRADQTAIVDAQTKLDQAEYTMLHDPQTGVLNTTFGKDTLGLRDAVLPKFDDTIAQIGQGLTTPRQQIAFQKIAADRRLAVARTLDDHQVQQMHDYEVGTAKAGLESAASIAVANANDPARVFEALGRGDAIVAQYGNQLGLVSEEARRAFLETWRSGIHEQVITTLLSQGKDKQAKAYFDGLMDAQRPPAPEQQGAVVTDVNSWPRRPDGTKKGQGFLGVLQIPGTNNVASEYSFGTTDVNGQEMDIPSLVPTLTKDEVQQVLQAAATHSDVPQAVQDKAIEYARQRLGQGQSVFAQEGEQNNTLYPDLPRAQVVEGVGVPQSEHLTADTIARISAKLENVSTDAEAVKAATQIWGAHAPADDKAPINIDQMEADARARYADDPKTLKATIDWLRLQASGVEAGRAQRADANKDAVWTNVLNGTSYANISRTPEFMNLPGDKQDQIRDYYVRQSEHAANQAYLNEARANAAASRQVQELERALKLQEIKGYSRYFDLVSDPAKLATMSPGAIKDELPTIGPDLTQRLLNRRDELAKTPQGLADAKVDTEIFDQVANEAGAHPYAPGQQEGDKAKLGMLRTAVDDAVARQTQALGRRLTRDEQTKIAHSIFDPKVMIDGWFRDTAQSAILVNPQDRKNAYVPISQIPPSALGQALNYLRGIDPRLTDDQIKAKYLDRIQRAYARTLMHGTSEEIESVLNGGK